MTQGRVKFFSDPKGYGFARILDAADGERDVFIHFSAIQAEGFKTLDEDDLIEFDVVEGAKGLQAANVRVIDKAVNY